MSNDGIIFGWVFIYNSECENPKCKLLDYDHETGGFNHNCDHDYYDIEIAILELETYYQTEFGNEYKIPQFVKDLLIYKSRQVLYIQDLKERVYETNWLLDKKFINKINMIFFGCLLTQINKYNKHIEKIPDCLKYIFKQFPNINRRQDPNKIYTYQYYALKNLITIRTLLYDIQRY